MRKIQLFLGLLLDRNTFFNRWRFPFFLSLTWVLFGASWANAENFRYFLAPRAAPAIGDYCADPNLCVDSKGTYYHKNTGQTAVSNGPTTPRCQGPDVCFSAEGIPYYSYEQFDYVGDGLAPNEPWWRWRELINDTITPTPTSTSTSTIGTTTRTPTITPSPTKSPSVTASPTSSVLRSPTALASPTSGDNWEFKTRTPNSTRTPTATKTLTPTKTATTTGTPTSIGSASASSSATPYQSPSVSPSPSTSPSPSMSPSPSSSPTKQPTATQGTPTLTGTATATGSRTPTATRSLTNSATSTQTATTTSTVTATSTVTTTTNTATGTPTGTVTATPTPTATVNWNDKCCLCLYQQNCTNQEEDRSFRRACASFLRNNNCPNWMQHEGMTGVDVGFVENPPGSQKWCFMAPAKPTPGPQCAGKPFLFNYVGHGSADVAKNCIDTIVQLCHDEKCPLLVGEVSGCMKKGVQEIIAYAEEINRKNPEANYVLKTATGVSWLDATSGTIDTRSKCTPILTLKGCGKTDASLTPCNQVLGQQCGSDQPHITGQCENPTPPRIVDIECCPDYDLATNVPCQKNGVPGVGDLPHCKAKWVKKGECNPKCGYYALTGSLFSKNPCKLNQCNTPTANKCDPTK